MKRNRIPLKKRLERIREGYAGDEQYDISLITRLANIPILDYLEAFPMECRLLLYKLEIDEEIAPHMTFQEVARRVEYYYEAEQDPFGEEVDIGRSLGAMEILALPFIRSHKERERRRKQHEQKNAADTVEGED